MATGGPAGFGQGGQPNSYPSRALSEYGTNPYYRDFPDDWVGGQRGVAALPSRTTVKNGPAPSTPMRGPFGIISYHRGAYIEDAGAPRLYFENVLGHGVLPWSRPVYSNVAGRNGYVPPTQMPSWTYNRKVVADGPASYIPVQRKQIANFMVRRPYGDTGTGQLFKNGSLATFVASIQVGMNQQGRRYLAQAKTKNPWQPNLGNYGTAGSYGQTTKKLPTTPTNVPASYDMYGAY
jgi:hypothetical protein